MPLYEYNCQSCRNDVEVLVRNEEKPACPLCGSKKLAKQLSVVATPTGKNASLSESSMPTSSCGRPQCGMYGCQGME